jgi:hypothetical protein
MKKIAFFVEGETESEFVSKILIQLAGDRNISLKQFKITGGGSKSRLSRMSILIGEVPQSGAVFEAWIYISSNDERVLSDISDNYANLATQFHKVLGLRDLRGEVGGRALTIADLPMVEASLRYVLRSYTAIPTDIVIAVMEIETWFLAETNHYACVDTSLNEANITSQLNALGYNPYLDDLSLRPQAAEDLHNLYQVGTLRKSYLPKNRTNRNQTINCIDYANLYLNTKKKVVKLNDFINHIDSFLTPLHPITMTSA